MGLQEAKNVLINGNVSNTSNFFEENINMKLAHLQPEHLLVLKAFYDIADESSNLKENEEMKGFTDVTFSNILSRVDLSERTVEVCYNDLVRDGFILMTHSQMLYHYITPLGIKLIKHLEG